MAMTVIYNAGAQLSLGELNRNVTRLGRSLQRLSSGQKFNSPDVDGAGYVISERMREQIRSLFQDDQNVQNGASMVKTAERGVDQIISNLRTMKEKAIDAANDSNTDEDRQTIQKEFDQRRHIINDIAIGTQYNGKILLDGRWTRGGFLSPKHGAGGANTTVSDVVTGFKAGQGTTEVSADESGGSGMWKLETDKQFTGYYITVEMDFSGMKITNGDSYPTALQGQGFTILCKGCPQYINVIFDANKAASQSTYDPTAGIAEDGTTNPYAREFVIGVQNVSNAKELANAVYEGMVHTKGKTAYGVPVDTIHGLTMQNVDGKIFLTKSGPDMQFKEGTIPNPLTDPIPFVKVVETAPRPLWIHHGTQAGQHINVYIEDVRSKALGIDRARVLTKDMANDAIGTIDSAIETALGAATDLGAYLQRFEYTGSNITTTSENTQAAESTIRDADMAKEMATYVKYNILSQSAQSMLAQANQNASLILGFLQQ